MGKSGVEVSFRGVSAEDIGKTLPTEYFALFSEFMEKYLETLRGENLQNLTYLLKKMGLFDYNLKRLNSEIRDGTRSTQLSFWD